MDKERNKTAVKILAIDTSSMNCSVALAEVKDDKVDIFEEENSKNEKMHSRELMSMVDDILSKNKIKIPDLDLIACGIGPGSFTGIRIGIATCKAFVDSQNLLNEKKKILACAVNSLESLAYNVKDSGVIVSLIDCRNNNVYAGMTNHDDAGYKQIGDLLCDNIDIVLQKVKTQLREQATKKVIFVGDGSALHQELIKKNFEEFNPAFSKFNAQSAASIIKCAYNKFLNNEVGGQEVLSPLYLRLSQAERQSKDKEG